jgi:hypothetical protein
LPIKKLLQLAGKFKKIKKCTRLKEQYLREKASTKKNRNVVVINTCSTSNNHKERSKEIKNRYFHNATKCGNGLNGKEMSGYCTKWMIQWKNKTA